ncbi:MAG TPA: endonuclease/exonuclease/phosphatase family protein [Blastocatellia bacterium]|nr:endonuclease/exonuclease/phosphatase family protein [Blastocatellia bacterium]
MNSTRDNQDLARDLARFSSFKELRASPTYLRYEERLRSLFNEPVIYASPAVRPRLRSFLRVVQWNIERGSRLEGIIEVLNTHPVLRYADLLLLNELDEGMVRSENRNVAKELADALEAHLVYGVEYLELTKGVGAEARLPGENTSALHGNAILTRHDFFNPRIIRLPRCESNFESAERRLGGRNAILLELEFSSGRMTAATSHLDVVNTPACRGRQISALLQAIDRRTPHDNSAPIIIGGDFNTHTFARGTRLRTIKNVAVIFGSDPHKLASRLLDPHPREPALKELARHGYDLASFNDDRATSSSIVSSLDDVNRLPFPVRGWAMRRVGPEGLLLRFRLDWLAARGLRPLSAGEMRDELTGVESISPTTFSGLSHKGAPLSDHKPIAADVSLPVIE